jgi:hypothetical protein
VPEVTGGRFDNRPTTWPPLGTRTVAAPPSNQSSVETAGRSAFSALNDHACIDVRDDCARPFAHV